jgi:hypothetical protein
MTATYEDISEWFDEAKRMGCAYLIVGLDPQDHDNFPVYCKDAAECHKKRDELLRSGNGYDEIYALSLPKKMQMAERRALHFPPDPEPVKVGYPSPTRYAVLHPKRIVNE